VVAALEISDAGSVQVARVLTDGSKQKACIEKALAGGAFACTDDGKPATLQLSLSFPE
jgi:hypothetical protein